MAQLQIPPVTPNDLQTFQAKHFLGHRTPACDTPTAPAEDAYYSYEEEEYYDDDTEHLGRYPDGVKRTLTEEQIRIFRHSEIHAILRERQLREEEAEYEGSDEQAQGPAQTGNAKRKRGDGDNDEGGLKRVGSKLTESADIGSGTTALDYDDEQESRGIRRPAASAPFAGRRIISYED
ncbi:DUF3807 domain-containing protein [Aspergillus ruber CBS 135680]|uniref:Uncharacterized protein n=1 Tax=Aspergillus ruber (strain CBS 135680) TaxID=1388766 RepID=A0A017SGF0_ASPRC|nr:uncharacterized protein EURHEDRAFT_411769 [Aspergillus ruber CBS 135680]EYE96028.1 hypothetical protein EURHEDRAFT_411769 [Aspergillus ruber CBS 135680]